MLRSELRPYRTVVFLGSFLTFCLELYAAKLLLPRFGGSAYVWTSCVMAFQGLLLAGYLWSLWALQRFGTATYSRAHLALLLLPLLFFPLGLPAAGPGARPLLELLAALLRAFGVPFVVLSTTIPIVQSYRMSEAGPGEKDSYFLFAASNLGAMAALLAYPFLIEPFVPLRTQSTLWIGLYAVYAALHFACLPERRAATVSAPQAFEPLSARRRILWLLLAAAPCAAMLAATNLLALDFAAVPLMWVAPLAVYLLTFVLNFKRRPWYPGGLNSALLPVLGAWVALCLALAALAALRSDQSNPVQTARRLMDVGKFGYVVAALFVIGMICHRSLAESRPSSERAMTEFYGWTAAGGWLGSLCIGVLAPWLGRGVGSLSLDWLAAAALAAAALAARDWDALRARKGLAAGAALSCLLLAGAAGRRPAGTVFSLRNFYGVYSVVDKDGARGFFHGNTDHGMQSLDPAKAAVPLTYYNLRSPLREAFDVLGKDWRRIGVVGLGAGTIAAYGLPGQELDFYELDPDVAMIAGRYFTFLSSSRARVRVIAGDARLSLERDPAACYDALILDAFNSGSVPIHLLTEEALALDLSRVGPRGVLLLHVSNRYLDLRRMLSASSRDLGVFGAAKRLAAGGRVVDDRVPSSWVALSRDREPMEALIRSRGWANLSAPVFAGGRAWTDAHAGLLSALAL